MADGVRASRSRSSPPFPGHVYVVDAPHGEPVAVTRAPLTSSLGPSDWSADGASLLIARVIEGRPQLFLLDVASGEERRIMEGPGSEYSATFSHAGDRIAFHAEAEGASQIVVADLDGDRRVAVTSGPGYRYNPKWSPDDAWLLYSASDDGSQYDVRAVRLADGKVVDLVATPEDEREGDWLVGAPGHPVVRER